MLEHAQLAARADRRAQQGRQTAVRDRLTFELRRPLAWIPGSHRFAAALVRRLFRHRHRRLGRWAAAREA